MKKNLLGILLAGVLCLSLTACGNEEKKEQVDNSKPFKMTCVAEKEDFDGIEIDSVVTYSFNKDQYVDVYETVITEVFKDKKVYKEYKKEQQETVKDTSNPDITYDLKFDDDKKTLVFKMTINNVLNNVTDGEKDNAKASNLLKSNEDLKATCTLDGITREELK